MLLTSLLDFFLPRLCYCCNKKLNPAENNVCEACFSKFKYADSARITYEYDKDFRGKKIVSGFSSLLVFEKDKEIQHLIHALKYDGRFQAGDYLGKLTGTALSSQIHIWQIDLIVPVPLHNLKKIKRGYNQSYYIANAISRICNIPMNNKVVLRVKNTMSQTQMNLRQREENIRDAFKVKLAKLITDKNILLIDDVITTGSTMNECGRALLESGAAKIFAISSAVASLDKKEFDPAEDVD
jgi:ComF family protein